MGIAEVGVTLATLTVGVLAIAYTIGIIPLEVFVERAIWIAIPLQVKLLIWFGEIGVFLLFGYFVVRAVLES